MRTILITGGWTRLAPAAVLAVVAAGCATSADEVAPTTPDARISVVAAFYPLAEAAERVGGDRVEVTNLTPAGVDPHDVELTPRDRALVEDADVVVVMGRGFQPAVERAARARAEGVIEILLALPIPQGRDVADHEHGHDSGAGLDPHVWLDPALMVEVVEVVAGALSDADPDHAGAYRQRAAAYVALIEALDERFAAGLQTCERRLMVTAHEAFGWLAARYDLEQVGIAGLSPELEPSPRRLGEIADLVREEGITTIFHEVLVSPRVAETLAREVGVETALLDPIEGLTSDQQAAGETYISVMEANLSALRDGLGCA